MQATVHLHISFHPVCYMSHHNSFSIPVKFKFFHLKLALFYCTYMPAGMCPWLLCYNKGRNVGISFPHRTKKKSLLLLLINSELSPLSCSPPLAVDTPDGFLISSTEYLWLSLRFCQWTNVIWTTSISSLSTFLVYFLPVPYLLISCKIIHTQYTG